MKKIALIAVAALIATTLISQAAWADKCEYHQWRPLYCKGEAKPTPAPAAPRIKKGDRIVLDGIHFDSGSAKIKKSSYPLLNANVAKIKSAKKVDVTVVGYTDDRGSDAMNQKLSEARANSVRSYFLSSGIPASRVKATGRGESGPIASNNTASGRAQNRRIELEAN